MVKKQKRLFLLEYCDLGHRIETGIFETVGFEVEWDVWNRHVSGNEFLEIVLPRIEKWRPDVIVFYFSMSYYSTSLEEEPQEWIEACKHIRVNPNLQHTKIAAFLGPQTNTSLQRTTWSKRYDFYTHDPLRVVEHVRIIKHLVGEDIRGFEGVNGYLLERGDWKIQPYFLGQPCKKNKSQPDAEGNFLEQYPVMTHLLTVSQEGKYVWGEPIQSGISTCIVYAIRSLEVWQEEGLSIEEIERLTILADKSPSDCQLLIGVNDLFLKIEPKVITQILTQVQQVGGWQVFINEHLWFERFCFPHLFEAIVYQKANFGFFKAPYVL
ncbi:MAG: hypothetical protein JW953_11485 [Anaerolineae bacterium]|nr:hypothetical protein [Anaerolineae bacterium]